MVAQLRLQGLDCGLYAAGEPAPAVLVLAKRYDEASLAAAEALRRGQGTRLLLDLCDNHFDTSSSQPQWLARADRLRRACRMVDQVVCASPTLADVVRQHAGAELPVVVVPDAIDSAVQLPAPALGPLQRLHALRWRAFAAVHPAAPGRRLLWFGNHGSGHAEGGMVDLQRIAPALATHHARAPLTLTVVSNRWRSFRALRRGWRVPALYLPWSAALFRWALARHQVALVPAQRNPFTLCKTNNRLATAFTAGLAVAADALPAYEELRHCAVLGDWDAGLAALMDSAGLRQRMVAGARELLARGYSAAVIGAAWQQLLQPWLASAAGASTPRENP